MTLQEQTIEHMLLDPAMTLKKKKQLLVHLAANDNNEAFDKVLENCFKGLGAKNGKTGKDRYAAKIKALEEMIAAMEEGPARPGTFLRYLEASGLHAKLKNRAEIVLPDGVVVYAVVPDPKKVGELWRGDTVLLDARAGVVLCRLSTCQRVGEQATLLRRIDEDTLEVELEHQSRHIYFAGDELLRGLDSGLVEAGHKVIVNPQQRVAFCGVPPEIGRSRYRFLDREPVPDVIAERDIAAPKPFLAKLTRHIRREMQESKLGRDYRLFRCKRVFLTGVSGSGKTLHIQGFIRRMYEVISEETGIPLEEIPPRVMRLRASEIMSKWYGEAEQNVDKFFNEVADLSQERIEGPDGRTYEAPVLVIAEEVDGLTRERGSGHDNVDDRVQSTILQRLDTTSQRLRDSLVIFICTSNVPFLLDPAFIRRAGAIVEHFTRLNRQVFEEVLMKTVNGIPFARFDGRNTNGHGVVTDITAWLYGANSDPGVVELVYAGSTQAITKHRRDFLNGALVERAVQNAAEQACEEQEDGARNPGLTTAKLQEALAEQVQNILEHLTPHNAHHYLDVPRGSRVATVRPVQHPNPVPAALERSA